MAAAGKATQRGPFFGGTSGTPVIAPFRQELRELGWIEGQNVVIDYRLADNS
jgi:hypothetical protein